MKVIKNTTLELIQKAQAQGNKIEYYVRKDGGVRVKSINGVRYTGSNGNNALRQLMGQPLSEKKIMQRASNRMKIQRKRKVKKLPKEVREKFESMYQAWEKGNKETPAPNIDNWIKKLTQEHKSQKKVIQEIESQTRLYMNMADVNDIDRMENRWRTPRNRTLSHEESASDTTNAYMYRLFDIMRERLSKLPKSVADEISEWCYDETLPSHVVLEKTRVKLIEIGLITEQEGF